MNKCLIFYGFDNLVLLICVVIIILPFLQFEIVLMLNKKNFHYLEKQEVKRLCIILQSDEPLNVRLRVFFNQVKHAFLGLPSDTRKILGIYVIAIHILLIVLLLFQCSFLFFVTTHFLFETRIWRYTGEKQMIYHGGQQLLVVLCVY